MTNAVQMEIEESHRLLAEQRSASIAAMRGEMKCGEVTHQANMFLIGVSRHVSAVCDVLLPAVRKHHPAGRQRVKQYVVQVRQLERAVARAKGRLYGASSSAHLPWTSVWADLVEQSDRTSKLETSLVDDLAQSVDEKTLNRLAASLASMATSGPTRPHPHSPHRGRASHTARRFWTFADAFWDTAESRSGVPSRPVVMREGATDQPRSTRAVS
ncbi:MAG: hypothetical protein JWP31_289 [Aeromicrobium sp.]|nr:hypothetical protein [Aeromicrobium sp.]